MRENRTFGSCRGTPREGRIYSPGANPIFNVGSLSNLLKKVGNYETEKLGI